MSVECKECGAPAEVVPCGEANGVDFDGKDVVFELVRVECATGHRFNDVGRVVAYRA